MLHIILRYLYLLPALALIYGVCWALRFHYCRWTRIERADADYRRELRQHSKGGAL